MNLKVSVNLVTADVVVRSDQGAIVEELRPEDFTVYDNRVSQPLTHFSQDQLALAVAIVVDRSPNIAPLLGQLRLAARRPCNIFARTMRSLSAPLTSARPG